MTARLEAALLQNEQHEVTGTGGDARAYTGGAGGLRLHVHPSHPSGTVLE